MDENNQNNSFNEQNINLDGYFINSQGKKSFNGTNLFSQEDVNESQSNYLLNY